MRLSQICIAIAQLGRGGAWSPLALWPDGIATPGMWISPRTLTSEWQDYTGTTPVATPGTVADSSNPVGLALDIRAGATVLTDPGNHMLQSTSAARPLASARVNLLTYTEDFNTTGWRNFDSGMDVTTGQLDPDGNSTAVLLTPNTGSGYHGFDKPGYFSGIGNNTFRTLVKPNGLQYFFALSGAAQVSEMGTLAACFDLTGDGSVVRVGAWNASATIDLDPSGYYICTIVSAIGSGGPCFGASDSSTWAAYTGDGVSGIYFAWPDLRVGNAGVGIPPYQSVPGDGSTYATDFPIFQKYDGVDDGMATATFPAGTLIDGMDCMIAVRRDSEAAVLLGISGEPSFTEKYTGACINNPGDVTYKNCGTPTVWVDRVQLAGGTTTTRAALFAALTVGDWHILEYRNLNLSTWVAVHYGNVFTGLNFNGARGDILLYPSTASTEDKDAARQWLADYYGVTLP